MRKLLATDKPQLKKPGCIERETHPKLLATDILQMKKNSYVEIETNADPCCQPLTFWLAA